MIKPSLAVKTTVWGLALAGLIPFVWCTIQLGLAPNGEEVWAAPLAAYAAIILSFLGGAWWGGELTQERPRPSKFLHSNLPPVVAWLTFLPGVPRAAQFAILALVFLEVFYWDFIKDRSWYGWVRSVATAGAFVCLITAALLVR